MEKIENSVHGSRPLVDGERELTGVGEKNRFDMHIMREEIVVNALGRLWQELEFDGVPLIFNAPAHGQLSTEYHPALLDQLIVAGQQHAVPRLGQLLDWTFIDAPVYAQGIAETVERGLLLQADMLHTAEPGDLKTIPSAATGWFRYTFVSGLVALSTHFFDPNDSDLAGRVALPQGQQDEWLAFLKLLDEMHTEISRRERRGRIEIIGGSDDLVEVIEKTTFDDVVLPAETLAQVAAQRRIFDEKILKRYAALRVPRLRKVLLIGPPGTGKTTLLKAEGALHAQKGGLVFYVCAPGRSRGASSWQQLAYALRSSAESNLPTLVLVEDFEMFVSDPIELQLVLNTLDGIATPDNEAGTLLLATSNDPEKIDHRIRDRPGRVDLLIEIGPVESAELAQRFLQHFLGDSYVEEEHGMVAPLLVGQPGSHFREVCIAGAMRALDQEREDVRQEDLVWAHEVILNGRALASQSERFLPAPARKRSGFFGKSH